MINLAIGAMLSLTAADAPPAKSAPPDPLAVIAGTWQIIDTETGKAAQDCTKAQTFTVSPDRKAVTLVEKWADNWTAHYVVLHREAGRVLMYIDGEDRKTDWGDPVLWWAYFDGPDRFRWRRYDWAPDSRTIYEWRRCPGEAAQ